MTAVRGFKEGSGPGPVDVAYRALMGDTYPTRLGLNEARYVLEGAHACCQRLCPHGTAMFAD
jgi:hypothetical protein